MDFSNIARQLNESPDDPAYTVAAGNEEKATAGGEKQVTKTNDRKNRQKAQMSQTMAPPKKSEISYASEQARTERELLRMMESAKSDWRTELTEAMGPDDDGNHPFVDVMPFMDQKMQELKKQMKAAAGAAVANSDVGGERGASAEMRKEEVLVEGNPEVEARGKKMAALEKQGRAKGLTTAFRAEHPGSRQPRKQRGAKPSEGDRDADRRRFRIDLQSKYGKTKKQKKEDKIMAKHTSPRD